MAAKRQLTPVLLFLLGAVSLLGLHAEYAVIEAETFIFNKQYNQFSITESVTHWIVICVVWGLLALVLFYIASRVYGLDLVKKDHKPSLEGFVVAVMLLSSSVGVKYILLGSWQMAVDFRREGWFQFIFLYIYKLFETILLLLSAAFFQDGCERAVKIKNDHIPWGGTVLAFTWGVLHLITKGDPIMTVYYMAVAFFIGCAYLAARKNLYISYAFAAVLMLV